MQLSEAVKEAHSRNLLEDKQKQIRIKKKEKWEADLQEEKRLLEAASENMTKAEQALEELEMRVVKTDGEQNLDQAREGRKELNEIAKKIAANETSSHSLQVGSLD